MLATDDSCVFSFRQHLMKRIQRGPVRGISLKLQEAERERRMDFVPEVSAIDTEGGVDIDPTTKAMLDKLDLAHLPGLREVSEHRRDFGRGPRRGPRRDGERRGPPRN